MNRARHEPLSSLCAITAGPSGSLLENLRQGPEGVPVISPSDLTEYQTVDERSLRRVPYEDAKKLGRFALLDGDIVMVRQGALGRLAVIDSGQATWFYSSSCMRLRPRSEVVMPKYLAACLSYSEAQTSLLARATGTMVPSINSAVLSELPIPVPSLDEQLAIVEILGDIDSQLRIERAMIRRLEELKPAIFTETVTQARRL